MKSWTKKKANPQVLQGERGDDSVEEKEYVDAFVPPEWEPHCVPHAFDVSFHASQSMMLDLGVEDLWSPHAFKVRSCLNSLRPTLVHVHSSVL